ncbi:hypothetical protein ACFVAV_17530 [Nocardia sp. NPDC057663]|uniref:hypothetical protein n=1 Tax=Nocardia sp. NPDC057663 TaxID=3346201 RepID=UPI0036712B14
MSINEPAIVSAIPKLDGPVGYTLAAVVSDTADHVVTVTVQGPTAPRLGERLNFDVAGQQLSVKVVDVAHWFFEPRDDPNHREIVVTAQPLDVDRAVAQQLLDPETPAQWCARLASVAPATS